jgi:perosamine synthetase
MTTTVKESKSPALDAGFSVRAKRLPYARQAVDESDIQAVVEVLRSDWLTTGPKINEFETAFASAVGAREGVAVNSGTAALHAAMHAAKVGSGDEVIVPAITFVASVNCAVYAGATPVFADVDPNTLLIDPLDVERKVTPRTRAIVAVDYAGQPCDYDALRAIAKRHGLIVIADAAHSLGARYKNRPVGSLADLTTFSFHPVKHITTGEGGMIACDDAKKAASMRRFRNHGIDRCAQQRLEECSYEYDMTELGFNYRLTDFQCALGLSQLRKLPHFLARRQTIAAQYDAALAQLEEVQPLSRRDDIVHAYHLYVVRLNRAKVKAGRAEICKAIEEQGIGVNIHYRPVYLHSYYRRRFGTGAGLCPVAEAAYETLISLPMYAGMSDEDVAEVVAALRRAIFRYSVKRGVRS